MKPTTIRLKTDWREVGTSPADVVGDETPRFWRAGALRIEWAAFDGAGLLDLSNVTSVTLRVRGGQSATDHLMERTLAASDLDTGATLAQWEAGSHQHGVFEFDETETNLDVFGGQTQRELWLIVTALLGDGRRVVIGAGYIEIHASNWEVAEEVPLADPPSVSLTAAEADARFLAISGNTLTAVQRVAVLAGLGITVTNDELRVVCPDGATRRAPLSAL